MRLGCRSMRWSSSVSPDMKEIEEANAKDLYHKGGPVELSVLVYRMTVVNIPKNCEPNRMSRSPIRLYTERRGDCM